MITMPEIRRSELAAVRRYLTSCRDDGRPLSASLAGLRGDPPLRRRISMIRHDPRTIKERSSDASS